MRSAPRQTASSTRPIPARAARSSWRVAGVTEDFLQEVAHQNLIDQALVQNFEEDLDPPSQDDIDEEMAVSVGI